MIQLQQQREDERTRRFDLSLQQNRRAFQERATAVESRFARTEKRLGAATESLIEQRGRPERGTKEHFESLNELKEEHKELLGELLLLAKKLAKEQGLSNAYQLHFNVGRKEQLVYHFHFHLWGGWGKDHEVK